jgi:hypothetical protein
LIKRAFRVNLGLGEGSGFSMAFDLSFEKCAPPPRARGGRAQTLGARLLPAPKMAPVDAEANRHEDHGSELSREVEDEQNTGGEFGGLKQRVKVSLEFRFSS